MYDPHPSAAWLSAQYTAQAERIRAAAPHLDDSMPGGGTYRAAAAYADRRAGAFQRDADRLAGR